MLNKSAFCTLAYLVGRQLGLADPEVGLVGGRSGGGLDEDHLVRQGLLDGEVDALGRPGAPVAHGDGVAHLEKVDSVRKAIHKQKSAVSVALSRSVKGVHN